MCTESYVNHPKFLSVRNLKDEHKKQLKDNYTGYEDRNKLFFTEFTREPLRVKQKVIDYLNSLSKHRKLDWTKIWNKDLMERLYD